MRLRQLDVLRAIAVFLVLGRHMEVCPRTIGHPLRGFFYLWQLCGWMGVDLFFVLSGFLISGLLFTEHKKYGFIRLRRFYIRRGLKIYPAFYVFLAASVLIYLTAGASFSNLSISYANGLYEGLFIQNYGPHIWGHTWSLAIEEHFYIMIGLLLLFLARRRRTADPFKPLVPIFLAVAVILLALRTVTIFSIPFSHEGLVYPTHLRIDGLFFGVFLSYIYHFHQQRLAAFVTRWFRPILAVSLCLVATSLVFPLRSLFMPSVGFTCLYVGFGGILLTTLYWKWKTKCPALLDKTFSGLASVGVYSYSIYLWHVAVKRWGIGERASLGLLRQWNHGPLPFLVESALFLVGSFVIGIAMSKLIELPVLKLRDRLFPSRGAALQTADASQTQVTAEAPATAFSPQRQGGHRERIR